MVHTNKQEEVARDRLLYDPQRLKDICERLEEDGVPAKPTEIKRTVKTGAFVYEIRTALAYWHGTRRNTRVCDATWERCRAVEEGQLRFDGDELVPIQEWSQ